MGSGAARAALGVRAVEIHPKLDEVLIRIAAAGTNNTDMNTRMAGLRVVAGGDG
ncbi:hypothetical protein X770_31640 [Mesorhizobium sp. LSJC269B00]|nr:hypothetical protein X770_31640 [Mesorhizobium sp. LSJC269B00]